MKMIPLKPCEQCWETFEPTNGHQKYCSERCEKDANNIKIRKKKEAAIIKGESNTYLKLRFMVFRRDGFSCRYCGRTPEDGAKLNVDHVIPKSKGGGYELDNLVTACFECNSGKRDVLLTEREIKKIKEGELNGHL